MADENTKESETPDGRMKLNIELEIPVEHRERFRMIMYACGIDNFQGLINHSFSLLEWAALEVIRGHQVGSISTDGGKINLLDAPALRKVEQMRDEMLKEGTVTELSLDVEAPKSCCAD